MATHAEFGERTTGPEVAAAFADRIRGRSVLVTGVSPLGIGFTTTLAFASQNPSLLILASRTKPKLAQVVSQMNSLYPSVRVETVWLDLSSQSSIRQAAADVAALTSTLDILVNNAGLVVTSRQATAEGIEMTFGTNHIGTFLFTNLLLPLLRNAAKANTPGATRIVSLSSGGHRLSPIRFSDFNLTRKDVPPEEDHVKPLAPGFAKCETEDGYNGIVAYAQSKTGNLLFTKYLQEFLPRQGITAYAVQPGTIDTELKRDQSAELNEQFHKFGVFWKNTEQGSATTMVAALDPALDEPKGIYLDDCQIAEPRPHANDAILARRLWKLSEELVGETFDL